MRNVLIITVCIGFLVGCSTIPSGEKRLQTAEKVAATGAMKPVTLDVQGFTVKSYQKLTEQPQRVRLYIEGDGFAYITRVRPSSDPTPLRPVALELASVDPSPNVIYLARLCQYLQHPRYSCDQKYWTTHRYGANVFNLYMRTLNQLKAKHNIQEFELVGFSGGGTLTTLLAQSRTDVATLRTVAGNLDIAEFARVHRITPLMHSLNPLTYAERTKSIPQMHFVGAKDAIVPPAVVQSYLLKQAGSLNQAERRMKIVGKLGHDANWQDKWPMLLNYPLQ